MFLRHLSAKLPRRRGGPAFQFDDEVRLEYYRLQKVEVDGSWRHARITLKPLNSEFEPIVLTSADDGEPQVIAELVEVLGSKP